MELPKISIITPSFNQGNFLEETILSVLSQNYPNLEYIVIDGGSEDQSVEIIKKHQEKIHYWVSEKDSGQSEAINKGLKQATGEIVAWLNSDDIFLKDTLHRVASLFLEHPSVELLYGDVENLDVDGSKKLISSPPFEPVSFLRKVNIHQPGVFWKRKLHENIGLLDESLYYLMDYDLWTRIFFNYECLKVNELFSQFRIHPHSKTTGNPEGLYLEYRKVLSTFINSLNRKELVSKLKVYGIYNNPDEKKYPVNISFTSAQTKTLLNMYIQQCAIQEYSFYRVKNANKLLIASFNVHTFFRTLEFLIKNNLRVRYITSRCR